MSLRRLETFDDELCVLNDRHVVLSLVRNLQNISDI